MCALSQLRSEWVPVWTVIACELNGFQGLYAPEGVELVLEQTGPREKYKSNYYSATGCQLLVGDHHLISGEGGIFLK